MAIPLKAEAAAPRIESAASFYREFEAALSPSVIACTWVGSGGWSRALRLLPDGCADLVWDGEILLAHPAASVALRAHVSGAARNVGLRLRCGAAGVILGPRLGRPTPLINVWGASAAAAEARLRRSRDPADQRALLEGLVADRLDEGVQLDPSVLNAIDSLAAGEVIPRAARSAGLGERELRRRFASHVGLGPKQLQLILRFMALLRRLPDLDAGTIDAAGLAHELGYADQAHMIRECRRISGSTPGGLLQRWRA